MNDAAFKFRLGIFVLTALILLGVLIVLFERVPEYFVRYIHYEVRFREAPGLEKGMPVRKSGVKIGEVEDYDLDPTTGIVTVKIQVDRRYQLRLGDQAIMSRGLVLGDTAINFVMGEDKRPAPPGHVFEGKEPPDIGRALGQARSLADLAGQTLQEVLVAANNLSKAAESADTFLRANRAQLDQTVQRVNDLAGRANDLLNEENRQNLAATLRNFRKASDQFDQIVRRSDMLLADTHKAVQDLTRKLDQLSTSAEMTLTEVRRAVERLDKQIANTGPKADELLLEGRATLKRLQTSLDRADELLANLQQTGKLLQERAPSILKNVDEGAARVNALAQELGEFAKALNEADGTVRRLMSDPSLYNNLHLAAAQLNRAMPQLQQILRDLSLFADRIARHPELLGVGGVVNPSSGIKR
ncbi:MAG: MlaD family protein [Gemmatales bacterium]|nr:MlaD family protein [Gemmatales bacterium]